MILRAFSRTCGTIRALIPKLRGEFFRRLAEMGEPQNSDRAMLYALEVVKSDPYTFTCRGQLTSDGRFVSVIRFEAIDSIRYRIPWELHQRGYDPDRLDIASLPEDELRVLVDGHDGSITLGNNLGIVWVTESGGLDASPDGLVRLIDRLGNENLADEDFCIVIEYDGKLAPEMHVPRALDAIDSPTFKVTKDCTAEFGYTHPLSEGLDGLPEAVHRQCTLKPRIWMLRRIR